MICLAMLLGILGFLAMRRARRYHCYGGYGHHGGWGHHWHRGYGGYQRRGLFMALSHLDASPAQERAIINEVDKLKERLWSTKSNLKDARGDFAAAVRGPSLDDAALGAVLGRFDTATGEARAAMLDAIRNIHGVLDNKQREQLADILDRGMWRRGGSPYRM